MDEDRDEARASAYADPRDLLLAEAIGLITELGKCARCEGCGKRCTSCRSPASKCSCDRQEPEIINCRECESGLHPRAAAFLAKHAGQWHDPQADADHTAAVLAEMAKLADASARSPLDKLAELAELVQSLRELGVDVNLPPGSLEEAPSGPTSLSATLAGQPRP